MVSVFISYRRADTAGMSRRIYDALVEELGHDYVFRDVDTLKKGKDFRAGIELFILKSNVVLVLIGDKWIDIKDEKTEQRRLDDPDDPVRAEIEMSLRHERRVIPILVDDAPMPSESQLPRRLNNMVFLNAINMRHDHFEEDFKKLLNTIADEFGDIFPEKLSTTKIEEQPLKPSWQLPLIIGIFLLIMIIILVVGLVINRSSSNSPNESEATEELTSVTPTPISNNSEQVGTNEIETGFLSTIANETRISDWRSAGWTGRGIRIGVIDLSFGGFEDFLTNANVIIQIPAESELNPVYSPSSPLFSELDIEFSENPHGIHILQVIHEIAPDAELYACRYEDFTSFDDCVTFMEESRVQIVNHPAGVLILEVDGSSLWTQRVEQAINDFDILWINTAGNYANAVIEGRITPSETGWHQFAIDGVISETLCIPAQEDDLRGRVMLAWGDNADQNVDANAIDLRLYIQPVSDCSPDGENIGSGFLSPQTQTGDPQDTAVDWLDFDMSQPFEISILSRLILDENSDVLWFESQGVQFALLVDYIDLLPWQIWTSRFLIPNDSRDVLTVGALEGNTIASYSSWGLTYDNQSKPDLVAPGDRMILPNGIHLVGTSFSTAIVTGATALMWSADLTLSRDVMFQQILEATIPDPSGGIEYGHGRLFLPLPPE